MSNHRKFLHMNKLRHDAKEHGQQLPTSHEQSQDSFHHALSHCNTTLEALFQKHPTFIITNLNTKRLERKDYYILQSSNTDLNYYKQTQTHHENYTLNMQNPDLYFNNSKRNEDYLNTFLGILDSITLDLNENRAFLFIKQQET